MQCGGVFSGGAFCGGVFNGGVSLAGTTVTLAATTATETGTTIATGGAMTVVATEAAVGTGTTGEGATIAAPATTRRSHGRLGSATSDRAREMQPTDSAVVIQAIVSRTGGGVQGVLMLSS